MPAAMPAGATLAAVAAAEEDDEDP